MKSTPNRPDPRAAEPSLYEVLLALGFRSDEWVSIGTQRPGRGGLRPERHRVRDLNGWTPPLNRHVWFQPNTLNPLDIPRGRRGGEQNVARVRSLFADLDVKPGGLASMENAHAVVRRLTAKLGLPPVAVVESGHGLQPFWRVTSPPSASNLVRADNPAHLGLAEWHDLYQRWGGLVARCSPGVKLDNVYELSRLLRCPGSVNWKPPKRDVVTHVYRAGVRGIGPFELRPRPLTWQDLQRILDREGVRPLNGGKKVYAPVATDLGEAAEWVNAQPGAQLAVDALLKLGPNRALLHLLDQSQLFDAFARGTEDDCSAHSLMIRKVQHAVFSAQEGRAGLATALGVIRQAYLDVMDARRRGDLPGEARDAVREFYSAVTSAVAKARGRPTPRTYHRDVTGRITIRTKRSSS